MPPLTSLTNLPTKMAANYGMWADTVYKINEIHSFCNSHSGWFYTFPFIKYHRAAGFYLRIINFAKYLYPEVHSRINSCEFPKICHLVPY